MIKSPLVFLTTAIVLACSAPLLPARDDEDEEKDKDKDKDKEEKKEEKPKLKNFRTFTSRNGKSLEARVVARIDDERYTVETPEGKKFTFNIKTLSKSDQTYLDFWVPDAILDLSTADLKDVMEKMNYRGVELISTGNRLFATASADGKELKFVLDPGRSFSTLDPAVAKDLGLKLSPGTINFSDGAGKIVRSEQGSAKGIKIGDLEVKSHLFQVLDMAMMGGGALPGNTSGAIGADLLSKLNAVVDHGGKYLFMREQD